MKQELQKIFLWIPKALISQQGEILANSWIILLYYRNASSIASSRPIGLVIVCFYKRQTFRVLEDIYLFSKMNSVNKKYYFFCLDCEKENLGK